MYKITYTTQAARALLKMPRNTANLIRKKLGQLANDPFGSILNAKKLQERPGYRLRVGDWRVICEINKEEVVMIVLRIAPPWRGVPMTVQIIKQGNKPEWAVVPYRTYLQLVEKAEMAQDIQDFDNAKAALERGEEELIPSAVVDALLEGENPIKVWREYRGLSQQAAAEQAGISIPYLSQLETNKRKGSLRVLSAISKTLKISIEGILST